MKVLTRLKILFVAFVVMLNADRGIAQSDSSATAPAGSASGATDAAVSLSKENPVSDAGYTSDANAVKQAAQMLLKESQNLQSSKAIISQMAAIQDLVTTASQYADEHASCVSRQALASNLCREETSPHLQETLNTMNTVAGMVASVAVKDACSTMAKALRLGQAGLTAYTAACSASRAACESSCSTVNSNLKKVSDAIAKISSSNTCVPAANLPPSMQIEIVNECSTYMKVMKAGLDSITPLVKKDSDVSDKMSIAKKAKVCTYTYATMVVSAATGVLSIMNSMKQSSQCDSASSGTTSTQTLAEKCAIEANKSTTECICYSNPRLTGCENSLEKAGQSAGSNLSAQSAVGATGTTTGGLSSADLSSSSRDPASANSSANTGGAGAPTGGGGGAGLGGGGGGFGGKSGDGSAADKKGLSANILGGVGSGGGGGGAWGSGSGSAAENSKYRSYLPGGDKDPSKMAGQQNWTKEVTGQGGKSNWEKVRDRYRDNNGSLLNN